MIAPENKPIPEAPYRGIESFRFIDQQIFAARDEETWNLLSSILIYRGVLLYGGSGTGKSSLINAGLIPKALSENLVPNLMRVQPRRGKEIKIERIPIEADGQPPYLPSTFATDDSALTFECSMTDVYTQLKGLKRSQTGEARPLLIFDQFEEFVTLFEEASRGGATQEARVAHKEAPEAQRIILQALIELIHDETLPVKMLFVFREDYLGKLSILFENCPDLLDQYLRLLPPHVGVLQKIILAPFQTKELRDEFAKRQRSQKGTELTKLADQIAAELAAHGEGGVNLSELQIVCRKLWESDNPAALFKQKSIQDLIEEYWSDALAKFAKELYEPAVALLSHMITSSNTRNIVSEDDLLAREKENFTEGQLRTALDALLQSKLVRREPRYKVYFYEIVSEYLVRWIQRLKAGRLAELERIKAQQNLEVAKRQAQGLQKWRRGLAILSALMLVALLSLSYFYKRAKTAEATARSAEATEKAERETAEKLFNDLNKHKKVLQLLQNLTSTSVDDRLNSIRDIDTLAQQQEIPPEVGKLLPVLVLTDPDGRVVQAGEDLLSRLVQSNPELQAHANIEIEGQDNQDQKARADRIKVGLTAKGIFVADYSYGRSAPSTNLLKYCKISEGTQPPDELVRLISDLDGGNKWEMTVIPNCEKSDKVLTNHYEIWFASDKRLALKDLLAIEKQWKDAKASGNIAVLQRVFADEFTNTDNLGNTYNKTQWIDQLRGGDPSLNGWKISDPKLLSYGGNTATITFIITTTQRLRDTDTFVKRDGRWRVLASQSTPLE